ncbi:MAG: phospholipase D-like domain-containing protein [Gammaproteobacteria bacterium]
MTIWYTAIAVITTVLAFGCALHALLNVRDPGSALGWIAVCLLVPVLGPVLYVLFGINRVHTRARRLGLTEKHLPAIGVSPPLPDSVPASLRQQATLTGTLQQWPLTEDNAVTSLHDGDQAYPAMLKAIGEARHRVCLSSYIFNSDVAGDQFVDALADAADRGADVRVLVDGVGEFYSWPRISKLLRKRGVRAERFGPPSLIPPSLQLNLRNHRKILTVDGKLGFAGGMNISAGNIASAEQPGHSIRDIHFRFQGPVVAQLDTAFFEDWELATNEAPPAGLEAVAGDGDSLCRVVTDGPGRDLFKLAAMFIGAVSLARRRVTIVTPYFLPPRPLTGALVAAALRGVDVTVILPAHNNQPVAHWATRNMLWELLRWGVKCYYQPGPFPHTKLFLVDHKYAVVGSANMDPRSLRLNFELGIEIFDSDLTQQLSIHCDELRAGSREITLDELNDRSLPVLIRDSIAWLFTPYL